MGSFGRVSLAMLLAWICAASPALADCRLRRGEHVVLYSSSGDPSVLMWDSRTRLREYNAASFDVAQALLPHAQLARPGTRADVVSCTPNFVSSPMFHTPDEAVGIEISNGGLIRWVLGSDVRPLHHQ